MGKFCPKCGWLSKETKFEVSMLNAIVECPRCKSLLKENKEYWIPLYDKDLDRIDFELVSIAERKMVDFPNRYFPVPDNDTLFNIKIDGEWNGTPIGKKIQEKNEQLKRKVAGYEHEQKNIRSYVKNELKRKLVKQSK